MTEKIKFLRLWLVERVVCLFGGASDIVYPLFRTGEVVMANPMKGSL